MPFLLSYARTTFLLASLSIVIAGFATPCRAADSQANPVAIKVQQLALMPFLLGSTEAQKKEKKLEKNLDCQLQGLCGLEEDVFSGAEEPLTSLAQSELRRKFGDKVMPKGHVKEAYDALKKDAIETPRDLALRLGQSLGVDHVLVGVVWRYQERVGGAMGASEPASVAFSLFMVNTASQKLVWKGSFDKTQTSLSENLFDAPMFLKKGMKWFSAEELSSYGVQKVFKNLLIQ